MKITGAIIILKGSLCQVLEYHNWNFRRGYIVQLMATMVNNSNLSFVLLPVIERTSDLQDFSEINYCGNVLTIYKKTAIYAIAALPGKKVGFYNVIDLEK